MNEVVQKSAVVPTTLMGNVKASLSTSREALWGNLLGFHFSKGR